MGWRDDGMMGWKMTRRLEGFRMKKELGTALCIKMLLSTYLTTSVWVCEDVVYHLKIALAIGNAMVPWLKRHWVGWLAEWFVIPLIPLIWVELYAAIDMMVSMVGLDGNAWCWAKQLSNVWILWQVTHKCWIKTKRDSSWIEWVGQGPCSWGVFCRDGLVGRDGSKLGTSGPDLQNSGTRLHPTMS